MTTHNTRTSAIGILLAALFAACASGSFSDYEIREGRDLPEQFVSQKSDGTEVPYAGECRSPLVDPRTGISIQMIRSIPGQGDYAVPRGSYGVGEDELLRLDCETGVAIGIVQR